MSSAPSMTSIDHVRAAEQLLHIVQEGRDGSDPDRTLKMVELHLKIADSINVCSSTSTSARAMGSMADLVKKAMEEG